MDSFRKAFLFLFIFEIFYSCQKVLDLLTIAWYLSHQINLNFPLS